MTEFQEFPMIFPEEIFGMTAPVQPQQIPIAVPAAAIPAANPAAFGDFALLEDNDFSALLSDSDVMDMVEFLGTIAGPVQGPMDFSLGAQVETFGPGTASGASTDDESCSVKTESSASSSHFCSTSHSSPSLEQKSAAKKKAAERKNSTTKKTSNPKTAAKKKVCHNCGSEDTPLWRRDAEKNILCNACGLFYKCHGTNRPIGEDAVLLPENDRGISCYNCGTTRTSLWRRDELQRSVCNACGLYRRIHGKDRPKGMKRTSIRPNLKHRA
eukprot:Clim_evm48s149 gene=Clim_evmTU48s149